MYIQRVIKALIIVGAVWSFIGTASMYLENRSPIIRKYSNPLLFFGIYETSSAMNCMGASGITIGFKGALGGDVSHFVCWQGVQLVTKRLTCPYMFGRKKRSLMRAYVLSVPKCATLCISDNTNLRNDAGTIGRPDLVKTSSSTRS